MNAEEQAQEQTQTSAPGALVGTAAGIQKAAKKAKKPAPKGKTAKAKKAKVASGPKGVNGLTNAKQRPEYVSKYRKGKKGEKTAGGNTPIDCDDKVAKALRGQDLEAVYKTVAKALAPDETVNSLKAKYGKLNVGMQRMNLGNRLRGALNAK
jgi:hypothetical protein